MKHKNLILALENEEVVDQTAVEGEGQEPTEEPATGDAVEQVPAEPEATPVEAPVEGEALVEEPKEEATVEQTTGEEVTPEEGEAAAEVSEVVSPESFEEEEEQESEAEERSEEMDEAISYTEEAYDDVETLDAIQDTMQRSVDEGSGLDETAAQIAEIAVEAIRAKLDIKTTSEGSFALESFKTKGTTRLEATKLAIEAIEGEKQSIFKRIQAALKWLFEKMSEFVQDFFQNAEKLKEKLVALKADIDSKSDSTEGTVENLESSMQAKSIFKALSIDGKVSFETVSKLNANAGEFLAASVDSIKEVGRMVGVLTKSTPDQIGLDDLNKLLKTSKIPFKAVIDADVINNEQIVEGEGGSNTAQRLAGIEIKAKEIKVPDEVKVPVLNKSESLKLLDISIELLTDLISYKTDAAKLTGMVKEMLSKAEKDFKVMEKEQGESNKQYYAWTNGVQKVIKDLAMLPTATAFKTGRATGGYIAACSKYLTASAAA